MYISIVSHGEGIQYSYGSALADLFHSKGQKLRYEDEADVIITLDKGSLKNAQKYNKPILFIDLGISNLDYAALESLADVVVVPKEKNLNYRFMNYVPIMKFDKAKLPNYASRMLRIKHSIKHAIHGNKGSADPKYVYKRLMVIIKKAIKRHESSSRSKQ